MARRAILARLARREVLVALFLAGTAAQAAPFGGYHPAPVYSGISQTSFLLPMRDGVRIAMRLYRPTQDGRPVTEKLPVIWHAALDIAETGPQAVAGPPSGPRPGITVAEDPGEEPARDLAALTRHGYVVAVIARRGSGASFGRRRGYEDLTEAEDSYEITEWLARQPFSNGRIGVYGCSNTGEAAMHVLSMRPPHLQAVFAGCFSFNRFDGFARGGLIANWGAGPQRSLADDLRATKVDGPDGPALLAAAARSHAGSAYLLDLMAGMPYRDSLSALTMSRFWYEASVSSYLDAMRASGAALYIQAGWRDDFRAQGLIAWANYLPGRRYIVIGDWQHCANTGFDLRAEQLRFYDAYLKDIDTGIARDAPVHYQIVDPEHGTLHWQAAAAWPVRAISVTWHAQSDGALGKPLDGAGSHAPDGKLAETQQGASGHTQDGARSGAAEAGGTTKVAIDTNLTCPGGITDPRMVAFSQACDPSSGGARWTSPVLTTALTVVGHPVLHIRVGASIPQPRVFAYLEDLGPDGHAAVVTDARLALALRRTATPAWDTLGLPWHEAWEADLEPLQPGEIVDADIAFLPTAYVFAAGHRLRLAIAGADPRERLRPAVPAGALLAVATGQTTLTLPEIPQ